MAAGLLSQFYRAVFSGERPLADLLFYRFVQPAQQFRHRTTIRLSQV